jgi:hypothetical protein
MKQLFAFLFSLAIIISASTQKISAADRPDQPLQTMTGTDGLDGPAPHASVAEVISQNASNGLNTVFFAVGDSMSDSPGGTVGSAAAEVEASLQARYGWAGSGPVSTVDTGVGYEALQRRGTNLYGNWCIPIYASDGTANVLSSKPSSLVHPGPITEVGVIYHKWPGAGTICLIHSATGLSETNVFSAVSDIPTLAYTNFLISDSLTDHKITFASSSGTNVWGGFIFRAANNRGIEFYYVSEAGGTLSNMLFMGTNSLAAYATQFKPHFIQYHAKDNEIDSLSSFSIYSNRLSAVLNALRGPNGRVQYVSTPQQNGNTAHLVQNDWARRIGERNGWAYVPLSEHYPSYAQNAANGLMADDTHPSYPLGCTVWANTIGQLTGMFAQSFAPANLMIYKNKLTGTRAGGGLTSRFNITGYTVIDPEAANEPVMIYAFPGQGKTFYSRELDGCQIDHLIGPSPNKTTHAEVYSLISQASTWIADNNFEVLDIGTLKGKDNSVSAGTTNLWSVPKTFTWIGRSIYPNANYESISEATSGTLTLDLPWSKTCNSLGDDRDSAVRRLKDYLVSIGYKEL